MPQDIVDDPDPLTPQTGFPFAVIAFPVIDLVQMGALPSGQRSAQSGSTRQPEDPTHFEP
jgi:hypothetical protein